VSRQSSRIAFPSAIAIHARYGCALHGQAARESLEMLLSWFPALRRRRTPWQVVWPAPAPTHSARR
jgi:hypothetical protein